MWFCQDDVYALISFSGADVVHPGPGSLDKPSYTALVGSVDSATSKYMAGEFNPTDTPTLLIMIILSVTEVQNCRVEMIEGLKGMAYVSLFLCVAEGAD